MLSVYSKLVFNGKEENLRVKRVERRVKMNIKKKKRLIFELSKKRVKSVEDYRFLSVI